MFLLLSNLIDVLPHLDLAVVAYAQRKGFAVCHTVFIHSTLALVKNEPAPYILALKDEVLRLFWININYLGH